MPIITIYQGASGSGQELAEAVAKELGYRCISREVLVEASRKYGIPQAKLKEIVEKGQPWLERILENLAPYRIALQAAFCELVQGKNIVYHGHIGHELIPNIKHVLKVLLTAPLEVRIEQVRNRSKLNHTAARRYVDEVDKARTRRIMAMFDTDWRDPSRYDLVLNLGRMTLEEATHMIVEAVNLPGYQPTVVSEERLQDITLAMRVHATLITSQEELMGARLDVKADGGEVSLSGILPLSVSEELIKRYALEVSGVENVNTDLTVAPPEIA